MSVSTLLRILIARWTLIVGLAIMSLSLVGIATFTMPKMYQASTDLIIDDKAQDPISGYTMSPQQIQAHIATQVDVIRSHKVTEKVIQLLSLSERPELVAQYQATGLSNISIEKWLSYKLEQHLFVSPRRNSSVLTIAVSNPDPELAAELADAYAEAYLQATLEMRIEPAKRISLWYEKQLTDLKTNFEKAQQALSSYQELHGIVSLDERVDIETERLAELSSLLIDAQSQRLDSQSRNNQLADGGNDALSADVLSNPLIMNLKTDLNRSQTRLDELSTKVGVNHPEYIQAKGEVDALESRLSRTRELVGGSMRSNTKKLEDLEEQLTSALAAQKEKVLALNRSRNDLELMRQDVKNAQGIYDATMTRATQAQLESQRSSTDSMVLNSAVVPRVPNSPNFMMNLFIGSLLGLLFGIAAALGLEWIDRRIRSPDELEAVLGIPVLACIPTKSRAFAAKRHSIGRDTNYGSDYKHRLQH